MNVRHLAGQMQKIPVKIQGEKSSALDLARGRIVFIMLVFMLCYIVLAAKLVDATIIAGYFHQNSERPSSKVENKIEQQVDVSANKQNAVIKNQPRADIIDRNGVILASSLKTASLYVDQKKILDPVETARSLAKIFPDMKYGDLVKKMQGQKQFVWIKRNLTPSEQDKILQIGDPGLAFEFNYRRVYPQGPLTSHFVGYTDVDGKGLGGIERSFNKVLSQQDNAVQLTLDVRLQHILRKEIMGAMNEFSGIGGAGMIMDVNSGEVLAAVSYPDFDPHAPEDPKKPNMFNRVTLGAYELGSTFKIFTFAALLEKKKVKMSTTYDVTQPLRRHKRVINDYHPMHRAITVPEAFMHSSNIATALMAESVGTKGMKDIFGDLGLMQKAKIELEEIASPILPSPWREISTLTASYGHGIAVTPVQLMAAVSTVVNGGYAVQPTLIVDAAAKEDIHEKSLRIISKETSLKMRQLLRLVVTEGTGSNADVPGYMVGGKTGTSEKIINGHYVRDKRMSSFVGVFPIDNPKYAVFVTIDEPKGTKKSYGYATAGWVAAPAVGRIIKTMAPILNIQPEPMETVDVAEPLKQFVSLESKE